MRISRAWQSGEDRGHRSSSSPFRVLSDEGAQVLHEIARELRQYVRPANERIENAELERGIADAQTGIDEMRAGAKQMEHYGG